MFFLLTPAAYYAVNGDTGINATPTLRVKIPKRPGESSAEVDEKTPLVEAEVRGSLDVFFFLFFFSFSFLSFSLAFFPRLLTGSTLVFLY